MAHDNEDLIIAPVPALVAVLLSLERKKGAPLSEAEVLEARDKASCIVMPRSAYEQVAQTRGYPDIDPERAWEEWQDVRALLHAAEV